MKRPPQYVKSSLLDNISQDAGLANPFVSWYTPLALQLYILPPLRYAKGLLLKNFSWDGELADKFLKVEYTTSTTSEYVTSTTVCEDLTFWIISLKMQAWADAFPQVTYPTSTTSEYTTSVCESSFSRQHVQETSKLSDTFPVDDKIVHHYRLTI